MDKDTHEVDGRAEKTKYAEPTLKKAEKLADITEGQAVIVSGVDRA